MQNNENNGLRKANLYSIKCMWVCVIILAVSWLLNVLHIFIVDERIMNHAFIGSCLIFGAAYLIKYTIGLDNRLASFFILFLMVAMLTFINIELSYHGLLAMLFPMLCSVLYRDRCYSIFTFLLTTAGFFISVLLSFRYGLCDGNMLLLTYSTVDFHAREILAGMVVPNFDEVKILLFFAFPRFLLLIGFTSLLNYIKMNIQERIEREVEVRRIAETDGLTGLYNRNKFKEYLAQKSVSKVAVIYIDINNLKMINDTMGHEQGDALILGMSDILRKHQSENCKVFRVGGDEFVAILDGAGEEVALQLEDQLRKEVMESKLPYDLILSAAMGHANGTFDRIADIIREADEKMYANKKIMKQEMK